MIKTSFLLIFTSLVFFSCDNKSQEQLNAITEKAQNAIIEGVEKAKEGLPAHHDISKLSEEQLNQFLGWEYKIIEYTTPPSGGEMEAQMNALGAERWDCVALGGVNVAIRIQCKRPTRAYLRKFLGTLF